MKKQRIFDLRYLILLGVNISAIVIFCVFYLSKNNKDDGSSQQYHSLATKLQSAGLLDKAAEYYSRYLESGEEDDSKRANVAYSLAEMFEQAGKLEDALVWYYKVETWDPESTMVTAARQKVVSLLEKLGKYAAAKRALARQTTLKDSSGTPPEGAVLVAEVDRRSIYLHEIDQALDRLPEQARERLLKEKSKKEFAQNYVAEELLFQKALRLGIDGEQEVNEQLAAMKRSLLVQKVIQQELGAETKIDLMDLKNFFEANKSKFSLKGSKGEPKFEDVQKQVANAYRQEKLGQKYQDLIDESLKASEVKLYLERVK